MMAPLARIQLIATTLLLAASGLFASAALHLTELATAWTTFSVWTAGLGVIAAAGGVGPWLWAQTVRGQRLFIWAVLVGSGAGLIGLLPGMSYDVVLASQATLIAAIVAESPVRR
jgi:hypothetical protein